MTSAIGVPDSASATGSPAASVTARMKKKPSTPDAMTACHIARGTTRSGSLVSSARFAADSKPTMVNAPSRNPSIHGPAEVQSPKLQNPSAGTAPLLNRFEKSMSPRTAATTSSSTVSVTMPMSSRETKALFTRSAHGVESATSRAWINSTIAVTIQVIVAVPS